MIFKNPTVQSDVAGSDGGFAVVYSYAGSPNVVAVLNPQAVSFRGTIPVHSLMQPGTHWQDWISGGVFTVTPSGLVIAVPPVPAGKCGRTSVCGLMILENVTGDVASSACREPTAQKQRALDDVMIVRSRKFHRLESRRPQRVMRLHGQSHGGVELDLTLQNLHYGGNCKCKTSGPRDRWCASATTSTANLGCLCSLC